MVPWKDLKLTDDRRLPVQSDYERRRFLQAFS